MTMTLEELIAWIEERWEPLYTLAAIILGALLSVPAYWLMREVHVMVARDAYEDMQRIRGLTESHKEPQP